LVQAGRSDQVAVPSLWIETAKQPAFGAAARQLAANMLDVADADRQLAALFKDAGHYIAAMSAAYLDKRGGLTLTLLRQICAGTGLMTANRAAALLAVMEHVGALQAGENKAYRTTPAFEDAWRDHLKAALAAAAILEPTVAPVIAMLDDTALYQHFLTIQATRLYALAQAPDALPSFSTAFLHPLAGCSILHALTLACTDAGFARLDGATVSLAALARRFGVSEAHVRRVLKRAEANGLLLHLGPGRRAFAPAGFPVIRYHYAAQLVELITCCRQLLTEAPAQAPCA
jgi:AraC-like DNA-binding protein